MTQSKIIAGVLAAVTLTGAAIATSAPAQAHHHHFGPALGVGLAFGALATAAAASSYYAEQPAYECRYVKRYNRWGEVRVVKICDVEPY